MQNRRYGLKALKLDRCDRNIVKWLAKPKLRGYLSPYFNNPG